MGMFNPKNRKVITAIIAIILVLGNVVPDSSVSDRINNFGGKE